MPASTSALRKMTMIPFLGDIPTSVAYAISPFLLVASILVFTRLVTTWNYYASLRNFNESPHGGQKIVSPPQIPYWLPWLGNTISFLQPSPGKFWSQLFSWHPRSTGICTILIGGRPTHIVFSSAAVQAMFKARSPSRDVFERELFSEVFEMPMEQIRNAEAGKHMEHEMNSKYLTNFDRVNELTSHFTRVLEQVLDRDAEEMVKLPEIGLYDWLRDRMFTASCTALLGEKLLEMYPTFCEDFYGFDSDFLSFFFKFPKFVMKEAIERRNRMFTELEEWSGEMHRLSGGTPVDPEGPVWEPYFGSRLNRARQLDYKNRKLNAKSGARLDAGITFGLSSNVIPATGWMLFHLLDPRGPKDIVPRVLAEINKAQKEDGTLDIATLMTQPLLQSIWTEILRLYTDVLVTRNLSEDLVLPLDEDGKRLVQLRKGDNLFAPSFLGHHDPNAWSTGEKPFDQFDAKRFLATNLKTGEQTFSTSRTAGKFFPFGGGTTICPGRLFAKQEALGALAMILLRFEFDVKGFTDGEKKHTKDFPSYSRAYPGSGAISPGGDMRVKIRRRQ